MADTWIACCMHCGCAEGDRTGHDDTCRFGCNDTSDPELFGDDPPMLVRMGPSADGGWEIVSQGAHDVLVAMGDAMQQALDAHDPENYIEVEVKPHGEILGYTMVICRPGKHHTPHKLRMKAEDRIERALQVVRSYDPTCGHARSRAFKSDLEFILAGSPR